MELYADIKIAFSARHWSLPDISIFLHFRENEIQDFSGFSDPRDFWASLMLSNHASLHGSRYFPGIPSFLYLHTISVFSS